MSLIASTHCNSGKCVLHLVFVSRGLHKSTCLNKLYLCILFEAEPTRSKPNPFDKRVMLVLVNI